MDFNLTEEQTMIRDTAREFAEKELGPIAAQIDEEARFPEEVVKLMGELGLMGIYIPEEYGGADADMVSYCLAVEEISKICASTGVTLSAHTSLGCDPILRFGSEELKKKYLVPMASGEKIGCLALTEPGAGSDVSSQITTAEKKGDEYIVNGSKIFITNGGYADIAIVTAKTDKEAGGRGMSAFVVERDYPGYKVAKVEHKLGIRASSTVELVFEDMRVPAENILGKEGMGFKVAMETLNGGRVGIASQALGIAGAALQASINFAKERIQFGKPIARLQAIQFMLADMQVKYSNARYQTYMAAAKKDAGESYVMESAMAKLYASEASTWITHKALQIHGGYGYTTDYPLERYYRDARITEIYEGTSEIQRHIIGNMLLK
ncbi:MAG: acyl-CoA dehydrogenase [Planctomycetes bacterium]|nr:acyl-CoA dehydrogenase [Planctomycetota bacterium]